LLAIAKNNQPGAAKEFNGCPFKHFSNDNLRNYLHMQGIPKQVLDEVIDLKSNHHY
jgi:hypothetical protein